MKIKMMGAFLALAMMSCGAWAQDEPKAETHKDTRTVTGCVGKKGDSDYRLVAKDGSMWDLKSDSVKLGDHVGHEVTLTGAVKNAGLHGAKEDVKGKVDKNATEHGDMTVTNLKMVSKSCEK